MRYADNRCTYKKEFKDGKQFYIYSGKCMITGKPCSVSIPAEELFAYRQGSLIQDAMPSLSKDDREFLISGISKEGWSMAFGEPDGNEPE